MSLCQAASGHARRFSRRCCGRASAAAWSRRSCFLVALRGPVYLAIGASKYPALRFTLVNSAVGTVEVALLVWLGYVFGRSTRLAHEVRWVEVAVALAMAAILIAPPLLKWRLLRSRKHAVER